MRKTVILIGRFLGELNHLKEALGKTCASARYLSFLDYDAALATLIDATTNVVADIVLIDESFPPESLPLLKTLSNTKGKEPLLILFTRPSSNSPQFPSTFLCKSSNKKDYQEFFNQIATTQLVDC